MTGISLPPTENPSESSVEQNSTVIWKLPLEKLEPGGLPFRTAVVCVLSLVQTALADFGSNREVNGKMCFCRSHRSQRPSQPAWVAREGRLSIQDITASSGFQRRHRELRRFRRRSTEYSRWDEQLEYARRSAVPEFRIGLGRYLGARTNPQRPHSDECSVPSITINGRLTVRFGRVCENV